MIWFNKQRICKWNRTWFLQIYWYLFCRFIGDTHLMLENFILVLDHLVVDWFDFIHDTGDPICLFLFSGVLIKHSFFWVRIAPRIYLYNRLFKHMNSTKPSFHIFSTAEFIAMFDFKQIVWLNLLFDWNLIILGQKMLFDCWNYTYLMVKNKISILNICYS